jgi:hypothetical protein
MEWWMLVVAVLVVALPYLLMVAFNAGNRADSRGRRIDHAWRTRRQQI